MAININQVRERLTALQSQTKKQDNLWKPTPGKHVIRIVPYKFNRENPFIELLFHYNMNGKTYLSPMSFGKPDPIVEFGEKLKTTGSKDDWKLGKTLEPKLRTFVPIVVREHETEGVKFWGFGKTVYQELLALIADPEYGDITDMLVGHDITVEFKSAEDTGKSFPSTTIRPRPSKTKITENKELLKSLFEGQRNILDIYKELSYTELEEVLQKWLSGDTSEEPTAENGKEEKETVAQSATKTSLTTEAKKVAVATSPEDISSELDKLFDDEK